MTALARGREMRAAGRKERGNGNVSRAHVRRCVHWLIGSQISEMPPELPQTCSSLQPPSSAGVVALQRPERARRGRPPKLATADRILAFMSDYDEDQHPKDSGGFTIEIWRTEL